MVTPPKGDFASVPLNPEGQKVGNSWDPATDGSCLAYGAAGLMREPTRLRITWENRSDAEDRDRRGRADAASRSSARPSRRRSGRCRAIPSPSGRSSEPGGAARAAAARRRWRCASAAAPAAGTSRSTTTMMSAGWLRKNGVPYSENATLTEYFDRFAVTERRRVVRRDHDRLRSEVPESGLRHQHPLQEGSRRLEVGA